MTKQYFGTDGIRGRVGEHPITPEFILRLGYAAGRVLAAQSPHIVHPAVLIGKDTRISGYMFEAALEAGLSAAGVDILLTGPMPTPAVAYLTRLLGAQAGIVISASHNPFYDNGIKFFSAGGTKLDDEIEHAIEAELEKPMQVMESARLGKARRIDDAGARYEGFCINTFPKHLRLTGLKIVLDCAHGATYHVAPNVFQQLGAEIIAIGNRPDGLNINENVGSTHPKALQAAVLEHHADLGVAFDGDGDRVMMVDSAGNLLDGDELLYIIAASMHANGGLIGGVVGTQMTNLAMEQALARLGVPFERAQVGDRHVLAKLNEKKWNLGGENSGHILTLDITSSGDAIIAALQVLKALMLSKKTLTELRTQLILYPQVLINITTKTKLDLTLEPIQQVVKHAEAQLDGAGRVLLRTSGTESKIRVMVEGQDAALVQALAEDIAKVVKEVSH
ncbi:MAG: phosphoglucosamine mutase [Methylophilaceae bacterium]